MCTATRERVQDRGRGDRGHVPRSGKRCTKEMERTPVRS